jgi:hypothetical protein
MQPNPLCVRQAWLDLYGDGTQTVPLDNPAGGWFCTQLDLGYPAPREVLTNWPNQDGADDRTSMMGPRVVTADITALAGAGARIDAAASAFGPYMAPSARPVLHYILDRPGLAERTIVLRGSGYSWPVAGANQRDLQLQWTAANPLILDPTIKTTVAWSGSSTAQGRGYPLTFNRAYPSGGGAANTGQIVTVGDIAVKPNLAVYGPITAPTVSIAVSGGLTFNIRFVAGFTINTGHYVAVNTTTKTAVLDGNPAASVVSSIDWQNTTWPVIPPNTPATAAILSFSGSSTSGITQVQASWADAYLT